MANQPTPVIDAVQDHEVEKVILSGTAFQSSILGPGAYRITAASVPLFFRDPIISGSVVALSELTCDGNSFDSSPRATIAYKWKKDTADITDATNKTYTTVLGDIDAEITCEVTITNASGNDVVLSNGLTIQELEPLSIYQLNAGFITGLCAHFRVDMISEDIYPITGLPSDPLGTLAALDINVMTGLAIGGAESILLMDIYIISEA